MIGFFLCLLLISCAPTPEAGQTYRHLSTGQIVKVEFVGKMSEVTQYIAGDEQSLYYPGRTPSFSTQMPGGTPDTDDICVVYKVSTQAAFAETPPTINYYVYNKLVFSKAFTKEE